MSEKVAKRISTQQIQENLYGINLILSLIAPFI